MLTCRACFWRSIHALDTSASASHRPRRHVTSFLRGQQQKLFVQTAASNIRKEGTHPAFLSEVDKVARSEDEPWRKSTQAAGLKKKERMGLKQRPATTKKPREEIEDVPKKLGRRDINMSSIDWNRRRKELQYLSDPLELATFVKKELSKDKAEEMLQLVRMASHSGECIVSWNHIIDYYLVKQRVSQALKVYNEMKKRAQFPDSYTYTILLRGLSINAHESGALQKALAVYHSLSAPNSRVEPSIIHTNAVLKVCARALDMDALWGVAAKIPETGPASANAITYVTILNATRQSLLVNVPLGESEEEVASRRERGIVEGRRIWQDIFVFPLQFRVPFGTQLLPRSLLVNGNVGDSEEEVASRRERGIVEGRRIWQDIINKWRNTDLVIEEELVCAMGRLLLIGGRPRDWDDVLSLVEQTMDIPRMVPRLVTTARTKAGYPHLRAPNVPEKYRYDDDHLSPSKGPVHGDEFLSLSLPGIGSAVSHPLKYATPSNNTLSMILEACQKIVANKAADEYWNLLTDPTTYGVVPDLNNINFRLRLLRQNRASASVVQLLKEAFVETGLQPRAGTFRIAMSTCVRDKNNHNSLKHGGQILHIMTTTLEDADPKTITMYADLAISYPLAKGPDLVDALALLGPIIRNIRLQLGVGGRMTGRKGVGATYLTGAERQDAITALRKIYALYDRLLHSELIPEDQKQLYKAERARLSSFLQRLTFKDGGATKWGMAKEALDSHAVEGESTQTTEDHDLKEGGSVSGSFKRPGSWREQKATLATGKRRPWFSSGVGDTA